MSAYFGTIRLRVVDQRDVDRSVLVGQLCVCESQCWCVYELIYTYRILVARARLRVHVCIYVHGVWCCGFVIVRYDMYVYVRGE